MNTRQLGTNGPSLTQLGFGAWAIGGPWTFGWGEVDDCESIRAIHRALDMGVNWIDTAAAYGLGHSEEVVARALEGLSQRPFVATKCGLVPDGKGGMVNDVTPAGIRQECEASLRRLHVDCIDLYQIHWPGLAEAIEDSWGAMARLQEEGKVRYIGVSNFGVDLLERCRKVAPVQSLQPPYSLLVRNFEETTKEYCRANHIGVVAYSPMQSGLLSGRFDRAKMASDDWRQQVSLFRDPKLSNALAYVERLRPIASRRGMSVGQLAIAWVLREEPVTSAIVGARTAAQVEENLAGSRWSLPASVIEEIGRINPG